MIIDNQGSGACSGTLDGMSPLTYTGGTGNDVVVGDVAVVQSAGQSDPTSSSPISFTVTFTLPVEDFTAADVVFSGTAHPLTATVSGSYYDFVVSVSGMDRSGTVIVGIPAGAAHHAGKPNGHSLSTDDVVVFSVVALAAAAGVDPAAEPDGAGARSTAATGSGPKPRGCGLGGGLALVLTGLAFA